MRQVKDGWYDSKHIFITEDGTRVLSKSEVIVYNLLFGAGLNPIYERELRLGDIPVHPDFTSKTDKGVIYWEHLGMLGDYGYRKDWRRKERTYAEHGISVENGNLVLSQDELDGSIDSVKIKSLIEKFCGKILNTKRGGNHDGQAIKPFRDEHTFEVFIAYYLTT